MDKNSKVYSNLKLKFESEMGYLQKITKELFKELEEMGLIDNTKNNANCYTTCRQKKSSRKKKYVCENVLSKYEYLKRRDRSSKK